jgi:hypothetical protein
MSHFSRLKTRFKNREILLQCLHDMGYETREHAMIQGYEGMHEVDIAIKTGKEYGIGFIHSEEGTYDMVADWWNVKGSDRTVAERLGKRMAGVQREYAVKTVLEQTSKEGYSLMEKQEQEDGSVRIVVRRWA